MTLKYQIKPHFKRPRLVRDKPRYSVSDLAMRTVPATKKRSRIVRINSARIVQPERMPKALAGWTVYRVDTQNTENKHRYIITVFTPTPLITSSTKVIIDSPNPLFVFRYEWAMARRGNAFIYRSNGQPPVQTNPSGSAGLDHHAYAALKFLVKESAKMQRRLKDRNR